MGQIFTGLMAEGTTDTSFLIPIIEKTVKDLVYKEYKGDFELSIQEIRLKDTTSKYIVKVADAAKYAEENFGADFIFVHLDADNKDAKEVYQNKINPAKQFLKDKAIGTSACSHIVPIVPITETESWMLADKALFKSQLGTSLSDAELKISRDVEQMADPKKVAQDAIKIAFSHKTKKRRRELNISELYQPIGSRIDLSKLEPLTSYQDFKQNIRNVFEELGYAYYK